MTDDGEPMMQNNLHRHDFDTGWIIPACRVQDKLGMGVAYQTDGKTFLATPDGDSETEPLPRPRVRGMERLRAHTIPAG